MAFPNAVQAANIMCAGILSHQSALAGGKKIHLPEWTLTDQQPPEIPLDQGLEPACGERGRERRTSRRVHEDRCSPGVASALGAMPQLRLGGQPGPADPALLMA